VARRTAQVVALAALAGLYACHKDPPKDKDGNQTANSVKAATAGKPAREVIEVPTEEDFEDAVNQQITPESDLNKELDAIEKQIGE